MNLQGFESLGFKRADLMSWLYQAKTLGTKKKKRLVRVGTPRIHNEDLPRTASGCLQLLSLRNGGRASGHLQDHEGTPPLLD